jgi:hypothetical protein
MMVAMNLPFQRRRDFFKEFVTFFAKLEKEVVI